jgi:hypothetical protein
LGNLVNFFLSLDRRARKAGHDLEIGGQVLVIVGIALVFQDAYFLSSSESTEEEKSYLNHLYLERSTGKRILADLVTCILKIGSFRYRLYEC